MSTPDTEGLRKAARRIFWEAKQLDEKAAASKAEPDGIPEKFFEYLSSYEGMASEVVSKILRDIRLELDPEGKSNFLDGVIWGMTAANITRFLNVIQPESDAAKQCHKHWLGILACAIVAHSGSEIHEIWKKTTLVPPEMYLAALKVKNERDEPATKSASLESNQDGGSVR